jgi:membrane associated rhomboid family serine protease
VWFPNAPVRTVLLLGFFVLFPQIRAKWLLGFWFVSQFFVNPNEGVAWAAHVGGFIAGLLLALLL